MIRVAEAYSFFSSRWKSTLISLSLERGFLYPQCGWESYFPCHWKAGSWMESKRVPIAGIQGTHSCISQRVLTEEYAGIPDPRELVRFSRSSVKEIGLQRCTDEWIHQDVIQWRNSYIGSDSPITSLGLRWASEYSLDFYGNPSILWRVPPKEKFSGSEAEDKMVSVSEKYTSQFMCPWI